MRTTVRDLAQARPVSAAREFAATRQLAHSRPLALPPAGSGLRPVPGDPGLPVIGYTPQMFYEPLPTARARYDRYGPVSWSSVLGLQAVNVLGPDATEVVLTNRDKAFSNGGGWEYLIGSFFPRGLMLLDFEEHHHHRRIMQQAFTNARLRGYLTGMNPAIARGLATWRPAEGFKILPAFKQLTLDVATEVFMGTELGPQADAVNRAFVDTVKAGAAFVRHPIPGLRWSKGLTGRRLLEEYFTAQLPAKRAGRGDDLFSALCQARTEDGQAFSDEDVIDHMIFLMMAAHDTSTITLTSMVYYLARHPEWQERVRGESLALGTPFADFDDLERLPALDWAMKETLRLHAPVHVLPRRAVKDTEILGHFIPRGAWVLISPHLTHHLAEYWPDPERFDPERFAPHRREDKVHRHAWVPFGGGVHKCIGLSFGAMEIKATMHQLLQRYRWSVDPAYRMPVDYTTLPIPKDGLPVRLERIR